MLVRDSHRRRVSFCPILRWAILFWLLFPSVAALLHAAEAVGRVVAIDARGKQYQLREHEGRATPWMQDVVAKRIPQYPSQALMSRQTGAGVFRLLIDAGTGRVHDVRVLTSTGFKGLDASAVTAFRQWRWKPE